MPKPLKLNSTEILIIQEWRAFRAVQRHDYGPVHFETYCTLSRFGEWLKKKWTLDEQLSHNLLHQ